ncbi:DUF6745 domain-containing protein [Actinacidiphila epipremni]|uniref:DUF6745 domain-containing protein n=1 Tax=Actinacidiphila epipremni TaxID=2053013 RepID=A0ABX1A2L9_9ACTN|nr:hypothetical protein [Actinacidiphila epipremni]NJP48031.1 hypothetical protein [Actinacidiphila epipremni]
MAETAAADRGAAEAGVRLAYRQAGLAEPERIVWVGSPLGALVLLSGAEGAERRGRSVREQVRDRAWAAERARLHGELGPLGWAARWGATGGRLWEVTQLLSSRIAAGVVEAYATATAPAPRPANGPWPSATDTPPTDGSGADGSPTSGSPTSAPPADGSAISAPPTSGSGAGRRRSAARVLLLDAVHGQQDAAWLSAFDAGPGSPLEGIAAVARAAGWWWPYERLAVLCDRPAELHRDEAGRLDRSDGPALAFRDGFALCSWRGMPVPGEFLAELATLTPERIRTEENAELRRVMLEHYGYDRYLAESGAVPQHRDETGVLWRIAMTGDEDTVMVEVLNSTPEPDGTTRTYWLRVPPTTRTAREGVAWTFGLSPEEYVPMRQT